jgi:hypothetical protein
MPREQFALARSADPGSLEPGLVWIVFLAFSSSLPFVAALADVTMGTITSAVAYMANVKSRVADLLMRLPPDVVGASLISRFPMGLLWSRRGKCAPADHVKATHSNSVTIASFRLAVSLALKSIGSTIMKSLYFGLDLSPVSTKLRMAHFS